MMTPFLCSNIPRVQPSIHICALYLCFLLIHTKHAYTPDTYRAIPMLATYNRCVMQFQCSSKQQHRQMIFFYCSNCVIFNVFNVLDLASQPFFLTKVLRGEIQFGSTVGGSSSIFPCTFCVDLCLANIPFIIRRVE